jgi:benzylsuccinate CoA-transferase BbsF subunit
MHHLSGYEDTPPLSPAQAYTDYIVNPHHSSFAIMAALHHRRRTGKGQYIDLAQYESIAHTTGPSILEYTTLGRERGRTGNRSWYAAPQGIYPCVPILVEGEETDRWCVLSIANDEEWGIFCDVIGRSELASDPRYASFAGRKENEEQLDEVISQWTAPQAAEAVMQRLQGAGIGAGVVQNAQDLLDKDPQMKIVGHYKKVNHPVTGESNYDSPPFTLSECPLEVRPGPLLGQHNDYIFQELLGLDEDDINMGYVEGFIA